MTSVEIMSIVCRCFCDFEKLQVAEFDSSNLLELTKYFGRGYEWQGHFKGVPVLAHYCAKGEMPLSEDWDFCGIGYDGQHGDVYCYNLRN